MRVDMLMAVVERVVGIMIARGYGVVDEVYVHHELRLADGSKRCIALPQIGGKRRISTIDRNG